MAVAISRSLAGIKSTACNAPLARNPRGAVGADRRGVLRSASATHHALAANAKPKRNLHELHDSVAPPCNAPIDAGRDSSSAGTPTASRPPPDEHVSGTFSRGRPFPLGATYDAGNGGFNFALSSPDAIAVTLVLFSPSDLARSTLSSEILLDPEQNRTGGVWHALLPNLDPSWLYAYRVEGPSAPGLAFDAKLILLDPYGVGVASPRLGFGLSPARALPGSPLPLSLQWPLQASALPSPEPYDWEGDRPLRPEPESLVIYELHVRGFTRDAGSGVDHPGTYRGLQDRLDYLQGLGVTALELLPVQEFNELEYYKASQPSRVNFWGYSTLSFFSPMARYASNALAPGLVPSSPLEALDEFRDFVKAAHRRGLAVILDVVFNHTAEGSEAGLSLSFRGVDNRAFYMLAPAGQCYNYSGCGNTLNANHPTAAAFVRDCLRWWVLETHVDGFRFDLASILTRAPSMWAARGGCDGDEGATSRSEAEEASTSRPTGPFPRSLGDETGTPLGSPPLIEALSADAALAGTLFIAEPWDCGGLNQAGAFPHYAGRWMEWNGPFRDAVRSFVKGTPGAAEAFASALAGSPQMFGSGDVPDAWWAGAGGSRWLGGRGPRASVNLVTSHDGFSLSDLCSFNQRHNDDNGEEGRDGEAHNLGWNCGEEGDSGDRRVELLRSRQRRNLLAALLLARGVPMLCQGDEAGHTKRGNNNTYCHDSKLNYLCWDEALQDAAGLRRFVQALLALRKHYGAAVAGAELQWLGKDAETGTYPESARLVACCCAGGNGQGLVLAFNAGHTPGHVSLPRWEGSVWQRVVDTSQASPLDVLLPDELLSEKGVREAHRAWGPWQEAGELPLLPYSCAVLVSTPAAKGWDPPQWAP